MSKAVKKLSDQNIASEKALRAASAELRAIIPCVEDAAKEVGAFQIDAALVRLHVANAIQKTEEAHQEMAIAHSWLNQYAKDNKIDNPGLIQPKDGGGR